MEKNKNLIIGIDESNHGRFPEIFVAAYSFNENFSNYSEKKILKERKKHNVIKNLLDINYNFLILREEDLFLLEKINKKKKFEIKGIIVSSLVKDLEKLILNDSLFRIFIDGKMSSSEENFAKEGISYITKISKNQIELKSGDKYDEHIFIVNFADSIAHYLFRNKSLEELLSNKYKSKRKEIIYL